MPSSSASTLARPLDDQTCHELHGALLEHHVLFARDQHLGPHPLRTVAMRFGEIDVNPVSPKVDGYPDVTLIATKDGAAPDLWHFDASFTETPSSMSLLSMVKCPPIGGDTLWISSYHTYEALSDPMRDLLDGLTVAYDAQMVGHPGHRAEHPAVRIHPETGRKCLYFDPMYAIRLVELSKDESDALLAFLRAFINDPRFACRFRWSEGTFAMWDNRCTLHRVATDFRGAREVIRVTITGDKPVGEDRRWPRFSPRAGSAGMMDQRNLDRSDTTKGY